jgi:Na+/proline symporter
VVTENLMPMLGIKLSDKEKVKWVRIWVGIIGFVAVIIALTAAVIYQLGVVAWSLLLVGLFTPFALGMYWKKANHYGGVAAFIGGFLAWAIFLVVAYNWGLGGDSTLAVCAGDTDCGFWDAVYISSFPAFFISIALQVIVSLATQKIDPPKPITDIDGKPLDTNPFHHIGIMPVKDAVRKLRKEEYDH